MSVSVAIITQDEEDRLPDCLKSVAFAVEVVVVDSGSQDNTVEIARSFGCKVFSLDWLGFARQKQFAVDHCSNHWVLLLDTDERITKEAADEIIDLFRLSKPDLTAYSFLRKNFFRQRWIKHCGWWPERVVRLVDRRKGHFSNNLVHEKWITTGAVKKLDVCIEHYSFRNYSDMIQKMQQYSTLSAREMFQKGKYAGWWSPILHGFWMFIKTYCFKLGVMEGFDGFMISVLNSGGSFMKYAKLRELRLKDKC